MGMEGSSNTGKIILAYGLDSVFLKFQTQKVWKLCHRSDRYFCQVVIPKVQERQLASITKGEKGIEEICIGNFMKKAHLLQSFESI